MNAPDTQRDILRHHVAAIEARLPIKIIGTLPRGSAAHIGDHDALDLLAEKRAGLSYLGISQAELDLGDLLGRPVGIVMLSELAGAEADELPRLATRL